MHMLKPSSKPGGLSRAGLPGRPASALALALALAGCADLQPPAAWEKGALARPEMRIEADSLEEQYREHVYTSKENASGGTGVGGGGCGCN